MANRTISPTDLTTRQIAVAAAAYGMSSHAFILAAISAALKTCAERDSLLGAALAHVGGERIVNVHPDTFTPQTIAA